MATTPTHAIVYPVVGNTITPLATHFANLANSVDTALTNLGNTQDGMIGTEAQRTATIAPRLREGLKWYSTDTNRNWFYDGTAWVSNDAGSFLLRPTTVTGGTLDATGTVIPTAGAATLAVDFSSSAFAPFRTVKVEFFFECTGPASHVFQYRRSGSILQAAGSYTNQRTYSNGITQGAGYVPAASVDLTASAQTHHAGEILLYNSGESSTGKAWKVMTYSGPANPFDYSAAGLKNDSEAQSPVDGFQFTLASSTWKSGAKSFLKFYGIA